MEETKIPLQDSQTRLGKIEIAPEVIEIISGIAANEVEGVYAMQGTFRTGMSELLGRSSHNKGVYLNTDEHGLSVDVYCYIKYGVSVPRVAFEMQQKIKEQVLFMSNLQIQHVNVHVAGLVTPKEMEKHLAAAELGLGEAK